MGVSFKGLGVDISRFKADIQIRPYMEGDSAKLEYGLGTVYAGFPASPGFGVGGQPFSQTLWLLPYTDYVTMIQTAYDLLRIHVLEISILSS